MGYHSYLVERFATTHENLFFRKLDKAFEKAYSQENGSHVLIGNLGVQGHSLDAIFIKRGAIIVIDFKDYSGTLTFSENGPWKITDDNDRIVFVSGGAASRNPFQQVNAYRFSLFPFLSENESRILNANHAVRWEHTNAMVLFHRSIQFDDSQIPPKIQRYFHVTDFDHVVQRFNDNYSKELELTDTEIDNILMVLNIGANELYSADLAEEEDIATTRLIDPARMDRIRQLIPQTEGASEHIKALAFYYSMIAIERINDSTISEIHSFPIDWSNQTFEDATINIENHSAFHEIFRRNLNERFPKNLFVSVNFQMDEMTVPLFYTVIVSSEIDDISDLQVNFNNFILFNQILSELQLNEDTIQELVVLVNDADGLDEKITAVRDYLNVTLELTKSISLGLSTESIYTSQLQSELRSLIKGQTPIEGALFKNFITGEKLIQKPTNQDNLIQITALNPSQQKAVELSFHQPLTVVTGPPGTGKSQVVINILANAVITGKKVLFASKNNKAVDNVYARINELMNTKYFLRLGSNLRIQEFNEILAALMQNKNSGVFTDLSSELNEQRSQFNKIIIELKGLKELIASIPILEKSINDADDALNDEKKKYESWLDSISEPYRELFTDDQNYFTISNSEYNAIENTLNKAKSGSISKLVFKFFQKKRVLEEVKNLNSKLPTSVREYVDQVSPFVSTKVDDRTAFLENIQTIQQLAIRSKEIKNRRDWYKNRISDHETNLTNLNNELNEILGRESESKSRILEIQNGLEQRGISLLRLSINESMRQADLQYIEDYRSYLNNQIPWRDNEKREFREVCNQFLNIFRTISITNLTIKKAFLLDSEIFDMVVIDEASQCDIASALPMIYRAKSAVIIGDPLQLPHITSVQEHEQDFVIDQLGLSHSKYNYVSNSLFNHSEWLSNRSGMESQFLDEHYRCHPDIVNFSNHYFYKLKAGQELTIRTKAEDFKFGVPGLHWVDVIGQSQKRNENTAEVAKCIQLATKLAQQFPDASIGIVTPFKHQKQALQSALNQLPNRESIVCDTVHQFQGDEKDIMILSLVVTEESRDSLSNFINIYSPFILNVAITRARSAMYIVGNKDYCKRLRNAHVNSLLSNLASYSEQFMN